MKKLILLSLAIISSSTFSYSNLEEQLCTAVNSSDVNKTRKLINQVGEVNPELKLLLIKSAQSNIEHYQNASKFVLLSSKDSVNLAINGAVIGGGYKLADYCLKKYKEFEKPTQVAKLGAGLTDFINGIWGEKTTTSTESDSFIDKLNDFGMQLKNNKNLQEYLKFEIKNGLCIAGGATAGFASLIAIYKIFKALNCSSASNKLNQAQAVYGLICDLKVKEIRK